MKNFAIQLVLAALVGTPPAEIRLTSNQQWPNSGDERVFRMNGGIAIRLAGKIEQASIGPVTISGAHQAIWTANDKAVIRDLDIHDVTINEAGREGIRIRGDADGVRIRDFDIRMRDEEQTGNQLPTGIALYAGRNITIATGRVSGFRMRRIEKKFTNGDGIASERAVDRLTITDVRSSDNSDGGFDLKGTNTSLDRLHAANNGRNYRFWGNVRAGTLTSVNARSSAIGIKGNRANPPIIEIDSLIIRQDKPVPLILVEGGPADIRIGRCDIQAPPGSRLVVMKGPGRTKFGEGCRLAPQTRRASEKADKNSGTRLAQRAPPR